MNQSTDRTALDSKRFRPWRQFIAQTQIDELDKFSGYGLTLDGALEDHLRLYFGGVRDYEKSYGPAGRDRYANEYEDVVIWEGNRVAAVVRPLPGETGPEVVRFDGDAPRAYIVPVPEPEADEPDDD